ncbi:MAG: hypothetical protein HY610_01930, partial [Elusimicrobia bacterium]|nr:hypothetical protein [Elusimicrobiota bacterium]
NSVLVIEHNLEVIKTADWIIDMGPEGGDQGGTVVAEGSPQTIARNPRSYTGQFLKRQFLKDESPKGGECFASSETSSPPVVN